MSTGTRVPFLGVWSRSLCVSTWHVHAVAYPCVTEPTASHSSLDAGTPSPALGNRTIARLALVTVRCLCVVQTPKGVADAVLTAHADLLAARLVVRRFSLRALRPMRHALLTRGKYTRNVLPWPTAVSTRTNPPA